MFVWTWPYLLHTCSLTNVMNLFWKVLHLTAPKSGGLFNFLLFNPTLPCHVELPRPNSLVPTARISRCARSPDRRRLGAAAAAKCCRSQLRWRQWCRCRQSNGRGKPKPKLGPKTVSALGCPSETKLQEENLKGALVKFSLLKPQHGRPKKPDTPRWVLRFAEPLFWLVLTENRRGSRSPFWVDAKLFRQTSFRKTSDGAGALGALRQYSLGFIPANWCKLALKHVGKGCPLHVNLFDSQIVHQLWPVKLGHDKTYHLVLRDTRHVSCLYFQLSFQPVWAFRWFPVHFYAGRRFEVTAALEFSPKFVWRGIASIKAAYGRSTVFSWDHLRNQRTMKGHCTWRKLEQIHPALLPLLVSLHDPHSARFGFPSQPPGGWRPPGDRVGDANARPSAGLGTCLARSWRRAAAGAPARCEASPGAAAAGLAAGRA